MIAGIIWMISGCFWIIGAQWFKREGSVFMTAMYTLQGMLNIIVGANYLCMSILK